MSTESRVGAGLVLTEAELVDRVRADRAVGRTFVFANGCFDVLHVSHVRYLAGAAREADRLIVAVNDDASVRGSGTRPSTFPSWRLATLLGAPPPPPPPDVPSLEESGQDGQPRSLRDRMVRHRTNPVCANCHQRMDPLGFSLEHFDALGKWRAVADGAPVDATASLPDGTRFEGMAGLRALLVRHADDYVRTLAEHLLAYAIGRGIEHHDQPAVREIARAAAAGDHRWSALILAVVRSTPFAMSCVPDGPAPAAP